MILIRDNLVLSRDVVHHFDYIRHQIDEVVCLLQLNLAEVIYQAGCSHVVEVFRHQNEVAQSATVFVREEILREFGHLGSIVGCRESVAHFLPINN